MEKVWKRPDGQRIRIPLEEEIRQRLLAERAAGHGLRVCIGTDSQVKGADTHFATVVVFIRKGKGGFMYIASEISRRKMAVRQRMLVEVGRSIDVAYRLSHLFAEFDVELEVHADINTSPSFKSNEALKEAMGYITGMGFAFRAKPHAFASSSCANRAVQ